MPKKSNIPTEKCLNCGKKTKGEYRKMSDEWLFYCDCGMFWSRRNK